MSDYRPVCVGCGSGEYEGRMTPIKNSVLIDYGTMGKQYGDLFQCPACGHKIITGLGKPFYPTKEA